MNGYSDRALADMVVNRVLVDVPVEARDRPFVQFGADVVSYDDMHDRARRIAAALDTAGVRRGDRVAIMMANSVDYVAIYFGLAYVGANIVLVNDSFRGYMLEYVLADAECAVVIADAGAVPALIESEERLSSLQTIVVPGIDLPPAQFASIRLASMSGLLTERRRDPDTEVAFDEPHCVVYSSGTTGPSKGIVISNAHALAKAFEVLEICAFTSGDVLYSPLPLFYSMGLLRGVLSVALRGARIVLRERFSVSAYWDEVRSTGATVAHSVFSLPPMLMSVPEHPLDRDHRLRCMFNARYDAAFEQRFGVRLIEGYGLTEAGNAIFSRLEEPVRPGSCGRVSDEWEVRIADPSGQTVTAGDVGEILIRPREPQRLMLGYLNKSDVTISAFRDLWFHTGDLGSLDHDGYYFYRGRLKDIIRRRGQNISAWEVEQILLEHHAVGEVAAFAVPAEVGDDDLRVVVVPADGALVDVEELAAHCRDRMPRFMVPRFVEIRDELPRTPSGRVEKYRLAETPLAERHVDLEPAHPHLNSR